MKVFGYQKDNDKLIELKEVTFQSDIRELEKLIQFLQKVKEDHTQVSNGTTDYCHSHYRDWDAEWERNSADIIVVTTFGAN